MNVETSLIGNLFLNIVRVLSYFIIIWWLINIYSIRYEIEKLNRIQLYCDGDIMEQETFRYNLYELNDTNVINKNVKIVKDKIETFKTIFLIFYWLFVVSFIILVYIVIYKYITIKTLELPFDVIIETNVYLITLSILYYKLDNNFKLTDNGYPIFKSGYKSKKEEFLKSLDKVLNNYFTTKENEKIYFMNDGLITFGDDFARDLAGRAIEIDELEQNNNEVVSISEKIHELDIKLFERQNGRVVKVKTELLLPYLQLNKNNSRIDKKNDIEIINEVYHEWVCSHDTIPNEPNVCLDNKNKNYIVQSLNNINTDNNYKDIYKELSSLITYGIIIGIFIFYFIYHSLYKNNSEFRIGVILSNIIFLLLVFIYYIIFIRYKD